MSRSTAACTAYTNGGLDPWHSLANAVILQTVKDYRHAWKTVKTIRARVHSGQPMEDEEKAGLRDRYRRAVTEIKCDERFFRSTWFSALTEIDGNMLLSRLKKEAA